MTVAGLKSLIDGLSDLTRLGLPGTKAQLTVRRGLAQELILRASRWMNIRDLVARVESDLLSERHDCCWLIDAANGTGLGLQKSGSRDVFTEKGEDRKEKKRGQVRMMGGNATVEKDEDLVHSLL